MTRTLARRPSVSRWPLATGVVALVVQGCFRSAPAVDVPDARAALHARALALDAEMAAKGFVEPMAGAFAAEGVYISAASLSERGPGAARRALRVDSLNATSRARWTIVGHGVSADGRDGYTFGHFLVLRAGGDSLPGSYKAYWRRDPAMGWQLLAMQRGRGGTWPRPDVPLDLAPEPVPVASVGRVDTIAMLREVMATELAFSDAAASGVGAAFASFAAPDGAKAGPERFLFGPEPIATLFPGPPPPSGGPRWWPEHGSVASSGDLAFTTGPVVPRNADASPFPPGAKYFTIWRRLPDGRWRYIVD